MSRTRRVPGAVAVIALTALLSACGSSAPTSGGIDNSAANVRQAVKFAACMRRNGVSQFPTPTDADKLTFDGIVNGSGLDPSTPAFQQAMSACKKLEPAGFTGTKRTAEQQSAALKFARCMRENGVKDFPDPAPGQPLIDTPRIPSTSQPGGMGALHAAMSKCSDAAAAAGVTR